MSVNKVILLGNLGRDPEMRSTASGNVTRFSVATSFRRPEQEVDVVEWHRVAAWGNRAEACAQYLARGSKVYVEGYLRTHQYDGQDGVTRSVTEIIAQRVEFLSRKSQEPDAEEVAPDLRDDDVPF
jgi:single-strand DNA-binding protein